MATDNKTGKDTPTVKTFADGRVFLDDPGSLAALVELMPEDERAEYKAYKGLTLESAFPGRKMVVYTLKDSEPSDIEIITLWQLKVDNVLGPHADVEDSRGMMEILTIPKRYRPRDLFLHIPQTFTLKYKGRTSPKNGVDFITQYAILMKTRTREHLQVDGHTYCCALNRFRERFPDLNTRY